MASGRLQTPECVFVRTRRSRRDADIAGSPDPVIEAYKKDVDRTLMAALAANNLEFVIIGGRRQTGAMETEPQANRKWPLVIYLHASLTTPESLYKEVKDLFALHDTYSLSDDERVKGFILLSPEARRAKAWPDTKGATQTGFRGDEWYRDAESNLDAAAIDHFLIRPSPRISSTRNAFTCSGGATVVSWPLSMASGAATRIAAVGQYAGASPWERAPCAVPLPAKPQVPLVLIRNLCDSVAPCARNLVQRTAASPKGSRIMSGGRRERFWRTGCCRFSNETSSPGERSPAAPRQAGGSHCT